MAYTPSDLIALATEVEKEGQYNAAKLLRAASASLLTRAATTVPVADTAAAQADALVRLASQLGDSPAAELGPGMVAAADAMRDGEVVLYAGAPDPFVCRICGEVTLEPIRSRCRRCGRWEGTEERFRPIYWATASTPPEALALLDATPTTIRTILDSGDPSTPGPDGGWSAHDTLQHLNNAQSVFRGRIDQFLAGEDPELASVMVWTMDSEDVTTDALFDAYAATRSEIVEMLSGIDPLLWWRRGTHEEFGDATLAQQTSYFANHEPTHLAQLADAASN